MGPSADPAGAASPSPGPTPRSPYLGLATFGDTEEDAALFFGRGAERDLVIANLRAARITVLYGPSGVGKSSLLHAGVAQHLRSTDPAAPVILIDEWDGDPAAEITAGITQLVMSAAVAGRGQESAQPTAVGTPAQRGGVAEPGGAAAQSSQPDSGPATELTACLDELRERRVRAPLIILDRFEDYLRRRANGSTDAFAEALATLVAPPGVAARVLIALRDDRLADLDHLEDEIPGVFGNVLRLEPMTRDAAKEAIVGPLDRYNALRREAGDPDGQVTAEPGLVDQVLDELTALGATRRRAGGISDPSPARTDVAIEPAFLSLTLRRIWDADVGSGGHTLRVSTLTSLGGAAEIFANHLDAAVAGLSAGERRLAYDVMRYLVTPSGATQSLSASDLADWSGTDVTKVEALAEKLCGSSVRVLRATKAPTDGGDKTEYELAHQVLARPVLEWRARYQTTTLERRARRLLLALVSVSAVALALIAYVINPGPLRRLELSTVDARFAIRGAESPDRRIVLVSVGAPAYARLAQNRSHRATYAAALKEILSARPRLVVVDVIFDGATTSAADRSLINTVDAAGPRVILAADELDNYGRTMLFGVEQPLFTDRSRVAAGYAGFPIGSGSSNGAGPIVRTMERGVSVGAGRPGMETLAVVASERAGGARNGPSSSWIDFRGGAGTVPSVSFSDVLAGDPVAVRALRNRIVILGVTAPAGGDAAHRTSAPGRGVMSGPELQAEAISTALRNYPLRNSGTAVDLALIIVLGLAPLALGLMLPLRWCVAALLLVACLYCVAVQLTFDAGRVLNVVFPLLSLAVGAVFVLPVLIVRRGHGTAASSMSPAR